MIAGVDGCKAGWIIALAAGWPCVEPPYLLLCRDFQALLAVTAECRAVMVDMPIGLPAGPESPALRSGRPAEAGHSKGSTFLRTASERALGLNA